MTAILGISAYYHDSAAALVVDGNIVAAAQEERFSRRKHDARFPRESIDFCLQKAGIEISDLDYVGFYEKPLRKFDRLIETYLDSVPWGYPSFRRAMPLWVTEKLRLTREISRGLNGEYSRRIIYCDHHQSHAASAFFPSPFDEAAILTVDGVGEWATACYGKGCMNEIELSHEMRFPHSIGLLYSAFTEYLGFRVNDGEYKVMGLAPFGKPVYQDRIREHLIQLNDDGSFQIDMDYFHFGRGMTMTNRRFHRLFDGTPRVPDGPLTQRDKDIAASIQSVTEQILLRMVRHVFGQTELPNLVLAGGVALNSVANRAIARDGPFDNIWVQPAAGDAGGALGAALLIQHQLLRGSREVGETDRQRGSFLGPEYHETEIELMLAKATVPYHTCVTDEELCNRVADCLASQKTVGWFQGRMEYGPRALGSRSILADPRADGMATQLNESVKLRESFRPFAPVVLTESASAYFDVCGSDEFPYMHTIADILTPVSIPAVTHVDQTARLQTADERRHPLMRTLLKAFRKKTGCAVLVNTSFNVRGEPIVCRPIDALRCFLATDLDLLVMGQRVLFKHEQSEQTRNSARRELDEQIANERKQATSSSQWNALWFPSQSHLTRFGISLLFCLPLLGWLCQASTMTIAGLFIAGTVVALLGILQPLILRPVYRLATIPLAIAVGEIGLLVLYGAVVIPMGIVSRLLGRDPLRRRRQLASNWSNRIGRPNAESYFHQS